MNSDGGVAIGTPALWLPTWEYVDSLLKLKSPGGQYVFLPPAKGMAPAIARNWIVDRFLETDCEWLLWVDSDSKLHPDTLVRLLSWNEPVVGVLAFTRYHPVTPMVYAGKTGRGPHDYWIQVEETKEWIRAHPELASFEPVVLEPRPDDALRMVNFTGCPCLLVRRYVYTEVMERPWFEPDENSRRRVSDRVFCEKVVERGVPIYVDRSVTAGHMSGDMCLGVLDFLAWDAITDWSERRFDLGKKKGGSDEHRLEGVS